MVTLSRSLLEIYIGEGSGCLLLRTIAEKHSGHHREREPTRATQG